MKIAYLGIKGLPSKYGADRVVEAIVNRLKEKHKLVVYCSKYYTTKDTNIPGIELIRVPCMQGKHLHAVSLFISSAIHAFFAGDYDLVHIHNTEACFVAPFLRLRYRIIATSHGPAYTREKWSAVAKFLIRKMDSLYALSPHKLTSVSLPLSKEYEKRWGKKVYYLPNGVENKVPLDKESARTIIRKNGVLKSYILFMAGRLDKTKGCHLLLKAFSQIDADRQLIVIGDTKTDPAYKKELRNMADKRVHFIPFIADKGVLFSILADALLFVFPSTIEAMSMALLEAASLGTPILCSDIPANVAVLPEQALYFKSDDAYDLKEKLQWALVHPSEMKKMGLIAQAFVKKEFSWDVIAKRYHQLYCSFNGYKAHQMDSCSKTYGCN